MTPLLIAVLALAGLLIGPLLRLIVVRLSVPSGEPWRTTCPACDASFPPAKRATTAKSAARVPWLPALPPTGRCPSCRARLGPPALSVELTAAVEMIDVGDDDVGEVDLEQINLLAQDERQQQVEGTCEDVKV